MKIKILLLTLFTLGLVQLSAQRFLLKEQKQKKQPILEKQDLQSFITSATITNSRSTQENEVWNTIANDIIPVGDEIQSLKMVNENTTWMISGNNIFSPPTANAPSIFKSVDAGQNWTQFQIPNTEGFYGADIAPISADIAFCVLWNGDFLDTLNQNTIYKTIDGGQTWDQVESYPYFPAFVHFFNEMEGWIMGVDTGNDEGVNFIFMSVTNDGGLTWNHAGGNNWIIPEGRALPEQDENDFVGASLFANSSAYDVAGSTILMGGTGYWISHDKGNTWENFESPFIEQEGERRYLLGTVAVKDSLTFALSTNLDEEFFFVPAIAYATQDGGQTWTAGSLPVNPSTMAYLPGTENDFIVSGQDQGFDPSFGFGITGTTRTTDLTNWEMVDDKGMQAVSFIGKNQGFGAFANYPGTLEAGKVFSWGPPILQEYEALVVRANDYPFTQITLNHLAEEVVYEYQIQNRGLNDLMDVTLTMEVILDGNVIATESDVVNVETDGTKSALVFYKPTEVGLHEFRITASQANLGAAFFTESLFLEVSETTLSKDDGVGDLSFSIIPDEEEWTHGYLGTEYTLLVDDKLASFSIVVGDGSSDSTGLYNFIIKAIGPDGEPEEGEAYKLEALPIVEAFNNFSHVTIPLPEPIDLAAGRYIFAVGQDEPQARVNFGFDNKPDPGFWMFSPVGFDGQPIPWTNVANGSFPTLMLRPNFVNAMSTSTAEEILVATTPLTVFPVPFKEELNILLEYTEEQEVTVQIFDLAGKEWSNFTTSHQQFINKNLSNLPNGLYLLKLKSGLYQRSVKVLKQ